MHSVLRAVLVIESNRDAFIVVQKRRYKMNVISSSFFIVDTYVQWIQRNEQQDVCRGGYFLNSVKSIISNSMESWGFDIRIFSHHDAAPRDTLSSSTNTG